MSDPASDDPHSRNLRLHRQYADPGTFFITKALFPRKPLLIHPDIAEEIVGSLRFSVEKERIHLATFVVMPDHWHVLLCTVPPFTIQKVMHSIDSWVGRKTKPLLDDANTSWQDGYHDTRIRSSKQFRFVRHYIENNPLEKNLVTSPADWKWSSANPEYAPMLTIEWPWSFRQEAE